MIRNSQSVDPSKMLHPERRPPPAHEASRGPEINRAQFPNIPPVSVSERHVAQPIVPGRPSAAHNHAPLDRNVNSAKHQLQIFQRWNSKLKNWNSTVSSFLIIGFSFYCPKSNRNVFLLQNWVSSQHSSHSMDCRTKQLMQEHLVQLEGRRAKVSWSEITSISAAC